MVGRGVILDVIADFQQSAVMEKDFFAWLDSALSQKQPKGIAAYNFNLYEGRTEFHVQLVGASKFEANNPDWPCHEVFSTGEEIFIIPRKVSGKKWQDGQLFTVRLIKKYLSKGAYRKELKAKLAVGVGFVDGDIELVFKKKIPN